MKQLIILILLIPVIVFPGMLNAQIKSANKLYGELKYAKAIPFYLKVVNSKKAQNKQEATVKLADCYRLTNKHQVAAKWYEKALEYDGNDAVVYYNYGNVLRTLGDYQSARQQFQRYLKSVPHDVRAQKYLRYCEEISRWKNLKPVASIKNASNLNSAYSDFSPVVYKSGIVFVSDRNVDELDNNNFYWTGNGYLKLFYSPRLDSVRYATPAMLSKQFNQAYHNGPVCFNSAQNRAYITRTEKHKRYKKDSVQTHFSFIAELDLRESKSTGAYFTHNSNLYSTGHVALSADGKKMVFASNKPGGLGESDLYYCELQNNEWTTPLNLGEQINSFGNEFFPCFKNDSTLFFASDGHMGYGGLDLFVSILKDGQWQEPENLKAPLNSSYDDFSIVFTEKSHGIFSSNRPEGKGQDDLYFFQLDNDE
ncbi:tetratricopeptide repeat protein [uncultured Draconibacterium sp.]|uniref:tetratricopeptide repeat protein n=1 Tax=uncultured Draconibacterium sp. TaxID=1573823 RepID=UPI00326177AB